MLKTSRIPAVAVGSDDYRGTPVLYQATAGGEVVYRAEQIRRRPAV